MLRSSMDRRSGHYLRLPRRDAMRPANFPRDNRRPIDHSAAVPWPTPQQANADRQNSNDGNSCNAPSKAPRLASDAIFGDPRPQARQQRRRNRHIHHRSHARINRPKEVHLCFMNFSALRAHPQMRRKLYVHRALSTRQRINHLFLTPLAAHRSFSANCFLAKNSLDFTVPIGMPNISETSSSVYP